MTRPHHEAGETLVELQSLADRIGEWLGENWPKVAAGIAGLLLLTGAVAGIRSWREGRELAAATALAAAQRDFFAQMGAQPGSFEFEEPANPDTARSARREASDRLLGLAGDHAGTAAALQARIDAAALLVQAGNADRASEVLREARAESAGSPGLTGLIELRIGQIEEATGRWSEAAAAYEKAAEDRSFPLWPWAAADAARAHLEAGQRERAVRLAEQLRSEAPQAELPPHLRALLDELRS